MLFLLLRLLTLPAPALPPDVTAVTETATRPHAAVDAATLRDARADLALVEAGPHRVRAMLPAAGDRAVYAGCVGQRLAEAQAQVAIAREEMQRLADSPLPPAEREHARTRLALLAQRTRDVERDAFSCVDEEASTITATKSETQVAPRLERHRDVTGPPPPPYPCPGGTVCTVIPEP